MKSIPRISLFLERVIQIAGMEHASFLAIIRRIFVYLKEIFSREFSQLSPVSKQVIADFAALFIVCAVVIVILLISSKLSNKNYDENIIHTEILQPENSQVINLTEEAGENNHESIYDLSRFNHGWGDGPAATPQKSAPRRRRVIRQKPRPYCIPNGGNTSRHSGFSVKLTQSQHSQSSQRKNRTQTSLSSSQTWLIRRTRSGQIYGKYPI
ncbi:uncharacterized protein [Chelonus insularis]|uniref:uncharacterized protein n=1 Tax=Chelonus insularis TaxID=460826 RepID=UPI001588EC00|nr:uncharacterized protein LOC118065132 [Chelonus insularis]